MYVLHACVVTLALACFAVSSMGYRLAGFGLRCGQTLLKHHMSAANAKEDAKGVVSSVEPCLFEGQTGVVLLAQPGEHDHFLMRAAVLIFEHNEQRGTQGVILGRASAFSLGETAPGIGGVFAPNTLFMGGEMGPDMAVMFHKYDLKGFSKYIGGGIYVGALKEAREMVEERLAHPNDFKFIFNIVEWGPGVLQSEIAQGRWDVVKMPPDMILQQKQASNIWLQARNSIRSNGGDGLLINANDDG